MTGPFSPSARNVHRLESHAVWCHDNRAAMINKIWFKRKARPTVIHSLFKTFFTVSDLRMSSNNNSYIARVKEFIPKLTPNLHKGQCGRIGVVGGSFEYTGAPYFAAISALKLGADLVYVICCREAGTVIKSYSPELIVYQFLDDSQVLEKVGPCLERLHSLVIGPGLGRDAGVLKNVESIINYCNMQMKTPLPLIIDADGLFLVTQNTNLVKNYKGPVVLTPNAAEYSRLCLKLGLQDSEHCQLARVMNCVLLKKGETDIICNGILQNVLNLDDNYITMFCREKGSVRRCGGQGDILSGFTAVFVTWFISCKYNSKNNNSDFNVRFQLKDLTNVEESGKEIRENIYDERFLGFSLACYASASVAKCCSLECFNKYGRSMTASDMIPFINSAFSKIF